MRLSHDQKEQALAEIRLLGTKKSGAAAANIPNIFSKFPQNT